MTIEGRWIIIFPILMSLIITSFFNYDRAEASEQTLSGIVHFPVKNASEGQKILIEAKIETPTIKVQYMRLYYRQKGQSNFQHLDMDEQLNNYIGEIPASEVKMPGIEYFIMAVLTNQSMLTNPSSNPYYAPYEITVNPSPGLPTVQETVRAKKPVPQKFLSTPKSGAQFETIILSPEPDDHISADEVVIAVSFIGEVSSLNLKSIKLFLDNQKITNQAEINQNMISFAPKNLSSGIHRVKIELKDKQGYQLNNIEWQFSVYSGQKRKIATQNQKSGFSGKVFAEWKNEKISGNTLSNQNMGANFGGKFGPIEYRGMAFITSREKAEFQPRNRFLLEVGTSRIGVKLGDTTPRFNELMLWGQRVRGIEAYLKLGFINLEFAQGQINRHIEGERFIAIPNDSTSWIHPINHDTVHSTTGIFRKGTYDRTLLAIRPSFGGGKNFHFGLNLIKVKDDPQSIQYSTQPKDNIVFGPDILFAIDNHRIELKASAAFSLLANDISNGAITKSELESLMGELPIDIDPLKFEKYFVLNTSLIPIPSDTLKFTSVAYQASFKFNYFNNNINIIYKSIGSEYYSLANNYLRKDLQGFSIYDRVRLYRNQIFLNLGYEEYLEGLSYEDDGDTTTAPTEFGALNIGISIFPKNRYLPKLTVNWKSLDRDDGLDTAYAVNYQNKDIVVQLGYDVQLFDLNHTFSISYITADRVDGFERMQNNVANDIRMLSLRTVYQIPLVTVISYASNQNSAAGGISAFKYNMLGVSADYKILNRRLDLKGGLNVTSATGSNPIQVDSLGNVLTQHTDYNRTEISLGGSFQINRQHSLLLDMSFINFNNKNSNNYKDSIIRFRYDFRY